MASASPLTYIHTYPTHAHRVDLDAFAAGPAPPTPAGASTSSNNFNSNGSNGSGGAGLIWRCADLLARLLPQWIPRGQDLYVVGVQECASLPRLREVLRAYLNEGEEEEGGGYAMFKTEIGDDTLMHGFIALTIFVRQGDVASGAFRLHQAGVGGVATGMGLGPMGRASNKVCEKETRRDYCVVFAPVMYADEPDHSFVFI